MNIAIDCRMSGLSGIGVYLDNIIEQWTKQKNEHTFTLFGEQKNLTRYTSYSNVRIVETNIHIFSFKELFRFPSKEVNKCDVFYSPFFNIPGGIHIPIFSTIHDVVFLDVEELTGKVGTFIRKLALQRAYRISKSLFTVSEFSKKRIQFHLGTKKDIVVTYSAINDDLKTHQSPKQRFYDFEYILFIGNIKKHKGLDILLKAYRTSRENGFTPKLIIVGDNKRFKTVDKEISQMLTEELDSNIVYTGNISNEKLYIIIEQALLLVQPSVYEGFGLPPLESLYLGCNILLSDIPVFREIYTDFPVSFFDRENLLEFSEKIQTCSKLKPIPADIRQEIDKRYNFYMASNLIWSQIERVVSIKNPNLQKKKIMNTKLHIYTF